MKACNGKKLNSFTSLVKFQQGKVNIEKTILSVINLVFFTNSLSTSPLNKYRITKRQIFCYIFYLWLLFFILIYVFIIHEILINWLISISDA